MERAFILGSTGQIGRAVAARLLRAGWDVTVASRSGASIGSECRAVAVEREELAAAVGAGCDLLLDCVAYELEDAASLVALSENVGRIAIVSSASVYCDARGRTLDEAAETGFPEFEVPIRVGHATVKPGRETYSTKKVAIEQMLLKHARCPVTVLRPCAIHGAYSRHAREWWFVKRLMDGRQRIPLAYGGRSRFQTTSVAAIAETVFRSCAADGSQTLNVADANAPTVREIGHAIMAATGREAELVGLADEPFPPTGDVTPWSVARPMICETGQKTAPYSEAVRPAVEWLIHRVPTVGWETKLPQLAAYPHDHFDYAADDAALARGGTPL